MKNINLGSISVKQTEGKDKNIQYVDFRNDVKTELFRIYPSMSEMTVSSIENQKSRTIISKFKELTNIISLPADRYEKHIRMLAAKL